jgi:hypothetical protein
MPANNHPEDLIQLEDTFNGYLDKLARGESTVADDVEPHLADTALRLHALAASTKTEIELMRNVWSTVQAAAGGDTTVAVAPGASRPSPWSSERPRQHPWRFVNHVALAAVVVVALITGYIGLRGGPPNPTPTTQAGSVSDPASTPYAVTETTCDTAPTTAEAIERTVMSPVTNYRPNDFSVLPDAPDASTIAAVQKTQAQLSVCTTQPLRRYALYSEYCLRLQDWGLDPDDPMAELKPGMVATAIADEIAQWEEQLAVEAALGGTPDANTEGIEALAHNGGLEVIFADDVELLSDGRIGTMVRLVSIGDRTTLIPQSPTYRFFVNVNGQWLYDCDALAPDA